MKEMYGLMGSVNEWINETKGLMKEYNDDMPLEDQENLKKRAEVKLSQLNNFPGKCFSLRTGSHSVTTSPSIRLLCAIGVLIAMPRESARTIRNTVLVGLVSALNVGGNYNISK